MVQNHCLELQSSPGQSLLGDFACGHIQSDSSLHCMQSTHMGSLAVELGKFPTAPQMAPGTPVGL